MVWQVLRAFIYRYSLVNCCFACYFSFISHSPSITMGPTVLFICFCFYSRLLLLLLLLLFLWRVSVECCKFCDFIIFCVLLIREIRHSNQMQICKMHRRDWNHFSVCFLFFFCMIYNMKSIFRIFILLFFRVLKKKTWSVDKQLQC